MDEQPGLSDQYRMSSPWPLLVAMGLTISEVGLVWPSAPLAVGGLLMFLGSIAGILRESEYVSSPWPLFSALSVVLVALGAGIYVVSGGATGVAGALDILGSGRGVPLRGLTIAIAGVVCLVASVLGKVYTEQRAPMA